MRSRPLLIAAGATLAIAVAVAGCGGSTGSNKLLQAASTDTITIGAPSQTPRAGQTLGFPAVATKNTTRVPGADPVADAALVSLAVYPSAAAGTHPTAVTLAPTDDWEAALAASVLMSPPVKAPVLLSGGSSLPSATADALRTLAPTGAGALNGSQVIRIGDVPAAPGKLRDTTVKGGDPYTLAGGIDRLASAAAGRPSSDVIVASTTDPAYAMPAAGWAAESGDPILFVSGSGIPEATRQALQAHSKPHIYALGPASVISNSVIKQLRRYGTVKRVGAAGDAANSVAFAPHRDPPCTYGQPCAHVPGSFGWAMRSPGHGYVLLNSKRPLDAAAAAPLSGSGDYGPALLVDDRSTLPKSVLNFFLDYATPGYTQEGPTAAVYNHGWVIGDEHAVSVGVQAEVDNLLQAQAIGQNSK